MEGTKPETVVSSINNEDYDAIESCQYEEDDDTTSRPSFLSAMPIYNTVWEPIIIYRKDKKRQRVNSHRSHHRSRIIHHTGRSTPLHRLNPPRRYARYLRDASNTMVNGRWRWVIAFLLLCFSGLWVLFAWIWMLISVAHGDLEDGVTGGNGSCSVGVQGFAGFLLMSVETQTTIGYGSRYPTENCAEGIFVLCLQMIMGIGVEGAVLGMFYVKMTRRRIRDCRNIFSKMAVVCQRDGQLCLMFRVSDEDHLHIVGTVIRAWLTETRRSEQGEYIEAFQKPLKIENPGLLLWPLTVIHKIDKNSPLYDVSAKDLLVRKFEIIVTLIGTSDSTGQLTQSRTSYLTSEIYWGHRFRPCVHYDDALHSYVVHQELMSATEPVDTPLCSSKRLDEVLEELKDKQEDVEDLGEEILDSVTSGIGSMTCSSPGSGQIRMGWNSSGRNGTGWSSPEEGVVRFEEILETDI